MLRQVINLFLQMADSLYGPITTIRQNGEITKKIPWTAFTLIDSDWEQVKDAWKVSSDYFTNHFTN